jgi:hypothetical protein
MPDDKDLGPLSGWQPNNSDDPIDITPPVTAADLRARAEATFAYKARVVFGFLIGRPLRRYPPPSYTPAIVMVCVATAACIGVAWFVTSQPGPPAHPPPYVMSRPSPLAVPTGDGQDGPRQLRGLEAIVRKANDPGKPVPIHVQAWDEDAPRGLNGYIAHDEYRWFNADGTVRLRVTNLPPQRDGSVTAISSSDPKASVTPVPRPSEFPADPADIAVALSARSVHILSAVADVHRTLNLSQAQRAEIFHVLANTSNVLGRGTMTDRLGRQGLAFTHDVGNSQDLIIVDPVTGALLAYEQYETGDSGPPPICRGYLIFLTP